MGLQGILEEVLKLEILTPNIKEAANKIKGEISLVEFLYDLIGEEESLTRAMKLAFDFFKREELPTLTYELNSGLYNAYKAQIIFSKSNQISTFQPILACNRKRQGMHGALFSINLT